MSESLRTLVEGFYTSRLANDADRCLGYFSPTARIHIAGDTENSQIAMDESGNGLQQQVRGLVGIWQWRAYDVISLIESGNRAVVHYRLDVTHAPSGTSLTTEICDLLTVEGGQVTNFVQFLDTATVEKVSA